MSGKLTAKQRQQVKSLRDFTGADNRVAINLMREFKFNVEAAANAFYERGFEPASILKSSSNLNEKKLIEFFDQYRDMEASQEILSPKTMERFVEDLEVDPNDMVLFILSWKCDCKTFCSFEKEEFMKGLKELGVDSLPTLKKKLPELRESIKNDRFFRQFYNFMFGYAKDNTQKSLNQGVAIYLWELLLKDRFVFLSEWTDFLQAEHNKTITRDTWQQLLDFTKSCDRDKEFKDYDEESAWPVLIDEFVEWMREKRSE